jgi:predicted GTPase
MFANKHIPMRNIFGSQSKPKGYEMQDSAENEKSDNLNIQDQVTDFFNSLSRKFVSGQRERLFNCVDDFITYDAKVGILGMTGAGKSSLCNALAGSEVVEVGMVDVCTRSPQEILLVKKERASLTLVDFPGMGVNTDWNEKDLLELYKDALRYLDFFLWVLKGDDRAYYDKNLNICRELFRHTEPRGSIPVIFVVSQVDKIDPARQWNVEKLEPGTEQRKNIEQKLKSVQRQFNLPRARLCAISSREGYGLVELIYKILINLPTQPETVISYSELFGANKNAGGNASPA